ncbi:MAG: formylglycine-generating enzyme family protein [Polyangiales bacterium]
MRFTFVLAIAGACGCIYVTGVSDYEKGACEGPCTTTDAGTETSTEVGTGCPDGMVIVAGGGFVPASTPGSGIVHVDALCVDSTLVTEAAYRACVASGACTPPPNKTFCNYSHPGRENDPINCIDLVQAKAFCSAQGKRLPTESEWEWVARGGPLGYAYPWGNAEPTATDDPELLCWSGKTKRDDDTVWPNRPAGTCAVKSFAGRDGLFDLAGNVWEWTSTPGDGTTFVFRGGSVFDAPDPLTFRVGTRHMGASAAYPGVGVRCFRSAGS